MEDERDIQKEINELKKEELELNKKLNELSKLKIGTDGKRYKAAEKARNEAKKERVRLENEQKYKSALNKNEIAFEKSFAKLSAGVTRELASQNGEQSLYLSIAEKINESKARQVILSEEEKKQESARETVLSSVNTMLLTSAQNLAKAKGEAEEINEFEHKRNQILDTSNGLTNEERQAALAAVDLAEKQAGITERINQLKAESKTLYESIPQSIRSSIDGAKGLFTQFKKLGPQVAIIGVLVGIVASAVTQFVALDKAASDFRTTTGLTRTQMEGLNSQVNETVKSFSNLGVEASDVFDTISSLKSEFADFAEFSDEVVQGLTVLNKNFGVAKEDSAAVQAIFENIGGLSSETATNLQLQVVRLAEAGKVAPSKVLSDINTSAEETNKFFKGDVVLLGEQAVEARRLGTSLSQVAKTAENLLNFQSSLPEELKAATFLNGQFNLTQARSLAAQDKLVEAQQEVIRQIQRSGDFSQKDFFTKQQVANAVNMTVGEIEKQISIQEKLNTMTTDQVDAYNAARAAGMDITKVNADQLAQEVKKFQAQQQQQSTIEQIENTFKGLAVTLGSSLVPLFETMIPLLELALVPVTALAQTFGDIFGFINDNIVAVSALATAYGVIYAISKKQLIVDKAKAAYELIIGKRAGITAVLKTLSNPVNALIAAGAAATMAALVSSYMSKADDVMGVPSGYGNIMVTKKGEGTIALNNRDTFVAGTNLMGGNDSGQLKVDTITKPMELFANEIRGLRKDMMDGKIGVYMDTQKVTSNITRQVERSTKNEFNLT